MLPPLVGSIGGWIALLNVYPVLYPWRTPGDKLIGIAVCALLAALGARAVQLADGDRLDAALVALGLALLLLVAVAGILIQGSDPTGSTAVQDKGGVGVNVAGEAWNPTGRTGLHALTATSMRDP